MATDPFRIVGTVQASHFHIEESVAEGGFAVVYRARHDAFRANVALKCLKVPRTLQAADREAFLEKFREEAELLHRLSLAIPAVVRPLQVGTLDVADRFVPFLALEWLDGDALDILRDQRRDDGLPPYDIAKLVEMLSPVAHGLEAAHRFPGPKGHEMVIHCDLKPDNLFLEKRADGEMMRLLDFGIARVMSAASATTRASDSAHLKMSFTPAYGAPEQWQPEVLGEPGPWTDVYGLAVTMVDVLVSSDTADQTIAQLAAATLDPAKRPTPRSLGVEVNARVEAAFIRALAVDPKVRTPSIEEFWSELEEAIGLEPSFIGPASKSAAQVARVWPELEGRRSSPSISRGDRISLESIDGDHIKTRGAWRISGMRPRQDSSQSPPRQSDWRKVSVRTEQAPVPVPSSSAARVSAVALVVAVASGLTAAVDLGDHAVTGAHVVPGGAWWPALVALVALVIRVRKAFVRGARRAPPRDTAAVEPARPPEPRENRSERRRAS